MGETEGCCEKSRLILTGSRIEGHAHRLDRESQTPSLPGTRYANPS